MIACAMLAAAMAGDWGYGGFARQPAGSPPAQTRIVQPTLIAPAPEPSPPTPPAKPTAERRPTATPAPKPDSPPKRFDSRTPARPTHRMWEGEDASGKTWHCGDRDELIRFLDARNRALRAGSRPAPQAYFPPLPQPPPQSYTLGPLSSLFGSPAACAPGGT